MVKLKLMRLPDGVYVSLESMLEWLAVDDNITLCANEMLRAKARNAPPLEQIRASVSLQARTITKIVAEADEATAKMQAEAELKRARARNANLN